MIEMQIEMVEQQQPEILLDSLQTMPSTGPSTAHYGQSNDTNPEVL